MTAICGSKAYVSSSTSVIESLSREVDSQSSAIAYFYCDYADSKILELPLIIGTLVQQLLILKPTISDVTASQIRNIYCDGILQAASENLTQLLCSVIDDYELVYLVLDGADETSPDTQHDILSMVRKLTIFAGTNVKVFFSSRDSVRISNAFKGYPDLSASESCNALDIKTYIQASVRDRLAHHSVIRSNPDLKVKTEDELVEKAHGM